MEIYKKLFSFLFLVPFLFGFVFGTQNVIDVKFSEFVNEQVKYNPLQAGSGQYFDLNENQSKYELLGKIEVFNNHPTDSVQDVVLNISGISNIYNVTYSSGSNAIVGEFNTGGDYMLILIPDLGPGSNSTLTYNINSSKIAPPLNFTSNYSDSKIFGGLSFGITDTVSNELNSTLYPNNCIYNINITQNALTVNNSGVLLNVTFDNTSISGSDASNVIFSSDNRTLNWNLWSGSCFNSSNVTDISYLVKTPVINIAKDYEIINSTISYNLNNTLSRINLEEVKALVDLDFRFEKYMEQKLSGDNATWKITSEVLSSSNITVNLTKVTLWVSVRDATGTGFTNPSVLDNDTISGATLNKTYNLGILFNQTLSPWNNSADLWYFNYTFSSSPIVWMDLKNNIINDGVQILNSSLTRGNNSIYIKEVYLVTGYWLEISKNITRYGENNYSVFIKVRNLGTSPTPSGQIVQVYNFIPIEFNLTSSLVYSNSIWYNTTFASENLSDPIYNGTMYQFGLIPNGNIYNSSLDAFTGVENLNNSWTLSYNLTGTGQFNYEDLFLVGVDPLHVKEYGATKSIFSEITFKNLNGGIEFALGIAAFVLVIIALLL
jgi:hypothetical protein